MIRAAHRFDVRKKEVTAIDHREMWAVCYADTGEVLCVTGPTDCQYCEAAAKARGIAACLNTMNTQALNQARSHV